MQLHDNRKTVVADDLDGVENSRQLHERDVVDILHFRTANERIAVCANPVALGFEPGARQFHVGPRLAENRILFESQGES